MIDPSVVPKFPCLHQVRVINSFQELDQLWCNFGRPTWSLACEEKNIFYMHAIKKVKKGTHIGIQNDFQNMFYFYDNLYGL